MNQTQELISKAQIELLENQNGLVAEELLLQAAELGSGHAAHELGVLYISGFGDLKASPKQSRFWLEKSLERGFEQTIASDPEWFKKSNT